jgi:outer membrane usher protein
MVFRIGVSAPLGGGGWVSGGASASRGGARVDAEISRPPPGVTGLGWRAAAEVPVEGGEAARAEVEARLSTSVGEVGAVAGYAQGRSSVRAYASGSVVLMGGRLTAASSLGSSFALIEVGQADVEVMADHRVLGRTGRDGRLLAPQLASLSPTRIEVAPASLKLDYAMPPDARIVRAPRGAGVRVALPVVRQRAVLARLLDPLGRALPAGATIVLNGREAGRTGFDGLAYLSDLKDRNEIIVIAPEWACKADLYYVESVESARDIDLLCAPLKSRDARPRLAELGQRGPELSASDGGGDLSRLRVQPADADERDGLHRHAVHVQRSGLSRLRLFARNTIRWLGFGVRPQIEARQQHRDHEVRPVS